MPETPPNTREISAEPPFFYFQPHMGDIPVKLFVGNVVVLMNNEGRVEQLIKALQDWRFSRRSGSGF